jgi:CRP/FNR family transcriptional regulator, cyclic AMP receptor protein
MDERQLVSSPLFAGLSKKECKALARRIDTLDIAEGKQLAREGDFAYEFFVIVEGKAGVTHGDDHVAELGPGDFFGEMGILSSDRRVATVTASSPMVVMVMTAQALRSLRAEQPLVAQRLEAAIQQRLVASG